MGGRWGVRVDGWMDGWMGGRGLQGCLEKGVGRGSVRFVCVCVCGGGGVGSRLFALDTTARPYPCFPFCLHSGPTCSHPPPTHLVWIQEGNHLG